MSSEIPQSDESQNKKEGKFMDNVLMFLGTSQSTFINQQFNKAIWKCVGYYMQEFETQTKIEKRSSAEITDYFAKDQPNPPKLSFSKQDEINRHCMMTLKNYTLSEFKEEESQFNLCRKECEITNKESGKIVGFIKNERCFKRCRINFESTTKDKVVRIFSPFLPELKTLENANSRRAEEQKIKEFNRANNVNETKRD